MSVVFSLPRREAGEGGEGVLQRESPREICTSFRAEAPPPQPSPARCAAEGEEGP